MRSDLKEVPLQFTADLPYPKIEVDTINLQYANLIQMNYAGMISEFSAINQYIYHEISLFEDYPDVTYTLKGISKVEMHHLQILGELIIVLGGNPGYWINRKNKKLNWSPNFVVYGSTLKEMLAADIAGEKDAIDQYRKTANQIQNENIVAIINRIILDEEQHIKLLNRLYEKYITK
ncbi:ferritin-like domain-containing protein [Clostridium chauvoei]|uniref:Rubrerythrin n=2 Tax=Clostridium chauvoei TaxID=46867 RepID=A0ABD4RFX9_9CLOT|nr:ferritin family protein [Clostridium chauvoei]ATD54665.1 hypothetical protein BTM20_05205 [Clostridium chauvoei]ATD57653.1 hypothetical protein BTM21_07850 [Clostridium chauvoei]MBX7279961.1 rubrerythrin [Clostridium chauvoei]MBX7282380.1 rubrerythrin [Clostridium chauvoei]MBX7284852.1 rubrerythrin [Clostridium chauvoei]